MRSLIKRGLPALAAAAVLAVPMAAEANHKLYKGDAPTPG